MRTAGQIINSTINGRGTRTFPTRLWFCWLRKTWTWQKLAWLLEGWPLHPAHLEVSQARWRWGNFPPWHGVLLALAFLLPACLTASRPPCQIIPWSQMTTAERLHLEFPLHITSKRAAEQSSLAWAPAQWRGSGAECALLRTESLLVPFFPWLFGNRLFHAAHLLQGGETAFSVCLCWSGLWTVPPFLQAWLAFALSLQRRLLGILFQFYSSFSLIIWIPLDLEHLYKNIELFPVELRSWKLKLGSQGRLNLRWDVSPQGCLRQGVLSNVLRLDPDAGRGDEVELWEALPRAVRAAPSHGHAGAAARLEAALALAALWPTAEACASHQFPLQTHLSVSPSTYLHWWYSGPAPGSTCTEASDSCLSGR